MIISNLFRFPATAVERLLSMPFFSVFHRLQESWELMAFTFCWDPKAVANVTGEALANTRDPEFLARLYRVSTDQLPAM
jgi:hypothetical protein